MPEPYQLTNLSNLVTLDLGIDLIVDTVTKVPLGVASSVIELVIICLSAEASRKTHPLETLHFHLNLRGTTRAVEIASNNQWTSLDTNLTENINLTELKNIAWEMSRKGYLAMMEGFVTTMLPGAHEKGLLRFIGV